MLLCRNHNHSIQVILHGFKEVFSRWQYLLFALVVGSAAFLFAVWLPNLNLIVNTIPQPIPFGIKAQLLVGLTESIRTNFNLLSATTTITSSILFGIDVALIIFYLRKRIAIFRGGAIAMSFGGMVSGVLGIGCAACGSFILSGILAAVGFSGGIALLPLQGGEFGILSIALLGISAIILARRIVMPETCEITKI